MDTPITPGFGPGTNSGNDIGSGRMGTAASNVCPACGQSKPNNGLEQFLGKLGISEEMICSLRSSMEDMDVERYLDTVREYLKTGSDKAKTYTKEHPAKVAAGVAVLAVSAGLLISALNRD